MSILTQGPGALTPSGSFRFFDRPPMTEPGHKMSKERREFIFRCLKQYICKNSRFAKREAELQRLADYREKLRTRAKKARMCIIDSFEGRLKNGLATNYEKKNSQYITYLAFYIGTHDILFYCVLFACTFHTFSIFFDPINQCSSSYIYLFLQYLVYFIYFVDIALKVTYEGFTEYLTHDWQVLYLFNLIIGVCDLVIFGCTTLTNPFRPLAGLLRLRRGRKFFDVLKKMIPQMLHDLIPIIFFVIFTSVLSTILFNNDISYFQFINNSFYSWWFLILTNDNFEDLFPNNMYGYLLYILFYFPLIYIGQRFLLNLIIGETYSTFQNFMSKRIKKDLIKSYKGMLKTFETMVEDIKDENADPNLFMDQEAFSICLNEYDPTLSQEDIDIYFELIASGSSEISKMQFLLLHQVLKIKFIHDKENDCSSPYQLFKYYINTPFRILNYIIFNVIPNLFFLNYLRDCIIRFINFIYINLPSTILLRNHSLLNFLTNKRFFLYLSLVDIILLCVNIKNDLIELKIGGITFDINYCQIISLIYFFEFLLRLFNVDKHENKKEISNNLSPNKSSSLNFSAESKLLWPISCFFSVVSPKVPPKLIYNPFPNLTENNTKNITKIFIISTILLIIYHISTFYVNDFHNIIINDLFLSVINAFKQSNLYLENLYQINSSLIATLPSSEPSSILSSYLLSLPINLPQNAVIFIQKISSIPFTSYGYYIINFILLILINILNLFIFTLLKIYISIFSLSVRCALQLPAASFITTSCTNTAASLSSDSLALHMSLFKDSLSSLSIISSSAFTSLISFSSFNQISLYKLPIDKILLALRFLRCIRLIELDEDLKLFSSNVLLILPDLCETLCFTFISSYFFGVLGHFLLGHAMVEWSSPLIGIIQAHKLNFMVNFLSSMEDSVQQVGFYTVIYFLFYLIFSLTVSNITLSIAIELHENAVSKNDLAAQQSNNENLKSALLKAKSNVSKRNVLQSLITSKYKLKNTTPPSNSVINAALASCSTTGTKSTDINFIQFHEIKELISIFLNQIKLVDFVSSDILEEIFDSETLTKLKEYHSNQITGQYNVSDSVFFSYLPNMYSNTFYTVSDSKQIAQLGKTIEKFYILIKGELILTVPSNQLVGEIDLTKPPSKTMNKCVYNSSIIIGGEFFSGINYFNYNVIATAGSELMEVSLNFFKGDFDPVLTGSFVKEASKSFEVLRHKLQQRIS